MAKIRKWSIPSVGDDVEQLEFSYAAYGNVKYHFLKNSLADSYKVKGIPIKSLTYFTPRYLAKRMKVYFHTNICT